MQKMFDAVNPATGATIDCYRESMSDEVEASVGEAVRAFAELRERPRGWQADLLEGIAEGVMGLGDALLEKVEAESALPRGRVTGERGRTVGQLKMFAALVREGSWVEGVIDTADAARKPVAKPDVRRMLVPRGPVAVFGASNFPLAFGVLGGDTASALAGGNPVVVKGHPSHPGTSEMLAGMVKEVVTKLGLPAGVFSLLQGMGHELSGWLVKHPGIEGVGFTGSLKGGRAIFDLAAGRARPVPVFAEMGSLNPLVVLPGAMKERGGEIAQGLAGSIMMGAGQFCTKPGVVLVIGEVGGFVEAVAKPIREAAGLTMLNGGLRDSFCQRTAGFGKMVGVTTHVMGGGSGAAGVGGMLFETTAGTFMANQGLREEAFGPGALVVRCRDVAEAMDVVRVIGGSLTGSVQMGRNEEGVAREVIRMLEGIVGRVIVNGFPTGVEVGHGMVHGGPYPATTEANSTSVGTGAARRFVRMVSWQDVPDGLLPVELQNANPAGVWRMVNGERTKQPIAPI